MFKESFNRPPEKATLFRSARFVLAAAMLSVVLVGCSRPTDMVIPTNTAQWDTQLVPKLEKLSSEEKALATGYLMRAKMGEVFGGQGIPVGTTLGKAIEDQRKWVASQKEQEAEAEALKATLLAKQTAMTNEMKKAVTVTLLEKSQLSRNFNAGRYDDEQVFKIGIKNTSSKELVGVSGELKFIDVFGKTVGGVTFRISESIAPGADYVWVGSRHYNQFIDEHRAVWDLEEGKYKTGFTPETLVYADGTKLELPQ